MTSRTRILADTNILVSAFLRGGKPARLLDDCQRGRYTLIICPYLLEELERVLRVKLAVPPEQVRAYLYRIFELSAFVVPTEQILGAVPADPADDPILACARAGRADVLLTGDHHLLELGQFEAKPILKVADFLAQPDGDG